MEVFTIGFTKKKAEEFFGLLRGAGIKRLLDVRISNASQLAGFTKQDDLAFFMRELCGAEYLHEPLLAPTRELLGAYKTKALSWPEYDAEFRRLMSDRAIEDALDPTLFLIPTVLLCSEPTPIRCHRRLVLEYLQSKWGGIEVVDL